MEKKILVVEDDESLLTLYTDVLTGEGFTVEKAVDGIEALEKARTNQYQVIVLDVVMPKLDGLECLKQIKKSNVKSKVVMTTNLSQDSVQEEIMKNGADAFIFKSETVPDQFVAKIKELIAGSSPVKTA